MLQNIALKNMVDFTERTFSAADYVIFAMMLAISAAVGIFFAIKDRLARKNNSSEFLLAGRSMSPYPVALSLSVSFQSAVLVLGTPSEVYLYGTMYTWFILAFLISCLVTAEVFIPIYYNLGISSVYEYLELRFHRVLRLFTTILFMIQTVFYTGVVMYAPALALNAVTGFDLWLAVISTGAVCILYSTLGGLKAVIWTDALQAVIMIVGSIAVLIQGSVVLGGIENIWRRAEEGGRIIFVDFRTDPRIRHSFWSLVAGGSFTAIGLYAVNQSQVQRYLCCKTLKKAKQSVLLNWVGLFFLNALSVLCGVVLYAYYKDCDPLGFEVVGNGDQLLPFMVLDIFQKFPGMPGVFMASIFSGSLSSISTAISAMSLVTVQDFIKPFTTWEDSTYTWVSKGLVIFYGCLCMLFAYISSQLGAVLQLSISILGLVGGPLVGIFSLGIVLPFANSIGTGCGLIVGFAMNVWLFVGSLAYPPPAEFSNRLPLSTAQCPFDNSTSNYTTDITSTLSVTMPSITPEERPPIADLYALSYSFYSAYGFCWTVVVGIIISLITGGHKSCKDLNPKLIYPFFDHWIFTWLPKSFKRTMWCGVRHDEKNTGIEEEKEERESGEKQIPLPTNDWSTLESKINGHENHNFKFDEYEITRI